MLKQSMVARMLGYPRSGMISHLVTYRNDLSNTSVDQTDA